MCPWLRIYIFKTATQCEEDDSLSWASWNSDEKIPIWHNLSKLTISWDDWDSRGLYGISSVYAQSQHPRIERYDTYTPHGQLLTLISVVQLISLRLLCICHSCFLITLLNIRNFHQLDKPLKLWFYYDFFRTPRSRTSIPSHRYDR